MSSSGTSRDTEALLQDLNSSQRAAATAPDGPLLVLAGAGSGKTRAIAYRIAYLIRERRVAPWTILALTFTNKAAGEMRSRVEALVGLEAPGLWVLTFHALGLRLLRRFGSDIGISARFVVYDENDRRRLIRQVLKEQALSERSYPVWRLASVISALKNAAFRRGDRRWRSPQDRQVVERVARGYQQLLDTNGALDFDDLLVRTVELFECSQTARRFAERRFRHVLVDEYQDTNRVQYRLLRLLAPHGNLFVVGDDDQSIYNFRGADLRNIFDFERDFAETRLIKLEDNYRSTAAILKAAEALISQNVERKGKRLIARQPVGFRPRAHEATDELDEAAFVARQVEALQSSSQATRIAVLFRTNAQSRAFEEEFVSRGIPHLLVGGQRFYERKEIKDALAYVRLVLNPRDNASFERVVNLPVRGVGGSSLALVRRKAGEEGLSLWEASGVLLEDNALGSRAHQGLASFREIITSLASQASRLAPAELLDQAITTSGLARAFDRESPVQKQTRLDNLAQLVSAAADYASREEEPTLAGFLDNVSLLTDIDTVRSDTPCLLMTLHSAKGLEFDAVFLTGLEEGLFPHTLSLGSARTIEEERRLCYVGMTRAKTRLTLTYAVSRSAALQRTDREPSRFLQEIPPELLDWDAHPARPAPRPKRKATSSRRIREGTVVRHAMFGVGTVSKVEDADGDQKITVAFRSVGRKKLLARYAELEIVARPVPRAATPRR